MHGKKRAAQSVNTDVRLRIWENEGTLWAVWRGSWDVGEGLVLWTLWHMFSLSPLPTSLNFFHWTINALLPWGVVTEGGMRGYHLLFINTGSGNTPHCQPNPLSLHLVPWQGGWVGVGSGGGGCRDQVQRPRCSANEDDRVFTLLQLWMFADEDRVGRGVMAKKKDPCCCLHTAFCTVLHLILSPQLSFCI